MPSGVYERSEKTIEKMRLRFKPPSFGGKHHTEKSKGKISKTLKNICGSEEFKKEMSEARKGENNPNYGNHYSEEAKGKISETKRREKSYFWKGGVTSLEDTIRNCFRYRLWRDDVFTRDNFTCQICGKKEGKLLTHHKKTLSNIIQKYEITTLEEALECAELWSINIGVTYCNSCHKKEHNKLDLNNKKGMIKDAISTK